MGSRIQELCEGQKILEDIIMVVEDEYLVDGEQGRADWEAFVKELCVKGVLAPQDKKRINRGIT